jgi:hypothetical protein
MSQTSYQMKPLEKIEKIEKPEKNERAVSQL